MRQLLPSRSRSGGDLRRVRRQRPTTGISRRTHFAEYGLLLVHGDKVGDIERSWWETWDFGLLEGYWQLDVPRVGHDRRGISETRINIVNSDGRPEDGDGRVGSKVVG